MIFTLQLKRGVGLVLFIITHSFTGYIQINRYLPIISFSLDIRADEENRNGLSQPEDNNRLSSHHVASDSFCISGNLNNNAANLPIENDRQRLCSESNSLTSSSDDSLEHYQGTVCCFMSEVES